MGGTFAVLGPLRVGYLDYVGSGAETIADLHEDDRITMRPFGDHVCLCRGR